jgi:hypothetical protein
MRAGRSVYGELVGGKYFNAKLDWNKRYGNPLAVHGKAQPKRPAEYKVVGKTFPQKIITEKVMGRLQYITDVKVDGMVHARVVRPPTAGCGPVSVDESSLKGIPGARVVKEKEFVAVIADREWDAVRAAEGVESDVGTAMHAVSCHGETSRSHPAGKGYRQRDAD